MRPVTFTKMYKPTKLLYLKYYKLKDREDIISYIVNKEDKTQPYIPPIPLYKAPQVERLTEASQHSFFHNFTRLMWSFAP